MYSVFVINDFLKSLFVPSTFYHTRLSVWGNGARNGNKHYKSTEQVFFFNIFTLNPITFLGTLSMASKNNYRIIHHFNNFFAAVLSTFLRRGINLWDQIWTVGWMV